MSINAAVFAVVVTTAPLVTAQLNNGGQIDLHEVPWFEVMTDIGTNRDRHPVIVMNPTHVATWANALKSIL